MIVTRGLGNNTLIATRGLGRLVPLEYIETILPQFITRRVSITNLVRRISRVTVVRREDD